MSDSNRGYNSGQYRKRIRTDNGYYERFEEDTDGGQSGSSGSISTIVANHYNSIGEKDITERLKSKIYFMRNFNNWIKSIIIRDTIQLLRSENKNKSSFTMFDLGCGKGGDLIKFQKSEITHLVGVDIAENAIKQCKERYRLMRRNFTAEFINIDCTRFSIRDHLSDSNLKFDMTSSQFSFHYSFESYEQVKQMVRNASECLKIGGIFCGTLPDSNEIIKRLKECGGNRYGNEVYSIRFDKTYEEMIRDGIPLFGAKYDFLLDEVVNCPEFLVYFPAFEEICHSFGLKLIFKKRFDRFFDENKDVECNNNLLNYMDALEKYPPKNNERMVGKPTDYRHVNDFVMNRASGQSISSLGTLSKSEWEAVTLYLVFSFRKISDDPI